MDNDAAVLGSGTSSASASVANFVWLVSFNLSGTTYLLPDRFAGHRILALKRSLDRPIAIDKQISLITAVCSDRYVAETVKHLSRDDAQAFVDVVDEVLLHSSVQEKWLIDLNSKFLPVPSRRWRAWDRSSRGSV